MTLDNADGQFNNRNPLSPYYGQLGRNTPIRVSVGESDTFTRTVVDGWGTSSSGHAWIVANGTASNFDVTGTAGTVATNSSTAQVAILPESYVDVDLLCRVRVDTVTGLPLFGVVVHWQDANNYDRVVIDTNAVDSIRVEKVRAGVLSVYTAAGSAVGISTVVAGDDWWIRASMGPRRVRAKAWLASGPEPAAWTIDVPHSVTTSQHGRVGCIAQFGTLATATFDDLQVVSYRFHGEVPQWPVHPITGDIVTIPIAAAGPLRRLSQNAPNLQSAMYREATKPSVVPFTAAYWPCEDGSDTTRFASGVPGVDPLVMMDTGSSGQTSTIPGSKAMGVLGSDGSLHAWVPGTVDTTGKIFFRIVLDVPVSPSTPDNTNIMNLYCTGGTVHRVALIYRTTGDLQLDLVGSDGSTIATAGPHDNSIDGGRVYLSIELVQNGANVDWLKFVNRIAPDNSSTDSGGNTGTFAGQTVGRCYRISAGTMDGWGFCHVGVGNDQAFMFGMRAALIGNSGEAAGTRMLRVAAEAGISLRMVGDPADTAVMGPQIPGSGLDVLRSGEAVDGGILYESRNEFGLTYQTLASMQNQTGPVLDYQAGHVTAVDPIDDDQALANDITVSRINGSSARAELTTGPLSTQDPPNGAGRYIAPPVALGVRSDLQLDDIASWRLHLGTWDELRFRSIAARLSDPVWASDPDRVAQLLALDSGDRFAIGHPPPWLGVEDVGQLVQGYRETLAKDSPDSVELDWHTSPAGPYAVGVWGSATDPNSTDTQSRYDTGHSQLSTGVGAFVPLNANPDFEAAAAPWTGANGGSVSRSTVHAHRGAGSLLLTPDGVSATPEARSENVAGISPTQALTVSAWVRCAVTRSVNMNIVWRNSGGGIITVTTLAHALTAGQWTLVWVHGTAPALTTQAQIAVTMGSTPAADHQLWIDEAKLGTATPLTVSITQGPVWTSDADDLPFAVAIGGERMTVTAVSGASSPQTFTVVRSVKAIAKSHSTAAPVELADPVVWAL